MDVAIGCATFFFGWLNIDVVPPILRASDSNARCTRIMPEVVLAIGDNTTEDKCKDPVGM